MQEGTKNNAQGSTKNNIKRSNAYPSISISKALEITEVIYKNAGNSFLSVENIANLLKKNPIYISQWLSSCVQYGLLELKSKIGYKPTDICKKIFKPFSDEEKKFALMECFGKPKLYVELLAKYKNSSLPSKSILPNILDRDYNVFDDASIKATEVFYENIIFLNLLTDENELVLTKNGKEENEEEKGLSNGLTEAEVEKTFNTAINNFNTEILKTEIPLTDSKQATLYYPKNITPNDIKILEAQLSLISLYINLNTKD